MYIVTTCLARNGEVPMLQSSKFNNKKYAIGYMEIWKQESEEKGWKLFNNTDTSYTYKDHNDYRVIEIFEVK